MNKTLILFEVVSLAFNTLIPVSFLLVQAPQKWSLDMMWMHRYISFNVLHNFKSYHWDEILDFKEIKILGR